MTHPNATPGKAIYLDEFIYEEGIPIGKCYQCDLPNPFTNNQVLIEGIDYVKQWQVRRFGTQEFDNCTKEIYDQFVIDQHRRIIALPLQRNITAGLEIDQVKEWQEIKNKQAEKLTTDEFRRVVEEAARTKSTYIFKEPTELQAEKREGEKESKLVFEVGAPVDFNSPEMKKEIERIHEHIKDIMEAAKVDTSKLHIKFNVC